MYFPFIKRSHGPKPSKDPGVTIQDAIVFAMSKDYDIADGGEFIDDGMRMKEQPLTREFTTGTQSARPYSPLQIQIQSQSQSLRPISSTSQPQRFKANASRPATPDPWRYLPTVTKTSATTASKTKPAFTGPSYHSPQEVVSALKSEGYTENFATDAVSLYSGDQDMRFHPNDFTIDKTFRFNANCGPNGNPIVYAITSTTGVKGTLTDTTGTCALHPDMVQKVYTHK